MRLIDADALMNLYAENEFSSDMGDAMEMLDHFPTVDAVPVVRCKDCKYKDDGIDEDGIPFLKCLNGRSYGGTRINDYCSWAERKEE